VLRITGVTRHQYYYRPKGKRPGRKSSTSTQKLEQGHCINIPNHQVVQRIIGIQRDPDTEYGYRPMCYCLKQEGYYINVKKVYRLMKENQLLKAPRKKVSKNYARYRTVRPGGPLEVLEMDIKYVWIQQARRHAYILTILDTFTRMALHWQAGFEMKARQVKKAWEAVIENHLQPADMLAKGIHIEIRNDNGPQFGANEIRQFFRDNYLNQVFTHPYTPQENGHIESFHSILSSALAPAGYWSLDELNTRLTIFYEKYNNKRIHGSIAWLSPRNFWEQWMEGNILKIEPDKKKVRLKMKIPYQQLSGNTSLGEASCLNPAVLDAKQDLQKKEVVGPETLRQPSVQKSPEVASC